MTATTNITSKDGEYVTHAPPPLHSIFVLTVMSSVFLACLPTWEAIDTVARIDTFTHRMFPDLVSLETLIYSRAAFGLLVVSVTFYSMLPGNGWVQRTNYLPGSKLRKTELKMEGTRTLLPYTSWSWNLLGISFTLNAIIAYQGGIRNVVLPQSILRVALILYEIAAPSSLLVSFVISHAIWPNILRQRGSTDEIKATRTLIWHNANVMMALTEIACLGGIPVQLRHFAVAPLFGIVYVLFTWSLAHYWKSSEGPQFIYFFFDTTLGAKSTYAILILLVVMLCFYGFLAIASHLLHYIGGGLLSHLLFVFLICAGVCRFRD